LAKRKRNIIKNRKYLLPAILAVTALNLLFIYFVKYLNQKLPVSEFRFFNFGNFLVFLITAIVLIGQVILFFRYKDEFYKRGNLLFVFPCAVTALLLASFILTKTPMNFGNAYFLQQPLNKFVIALFFFLYQLAQVMYLSYIWMIIMGRRQLLFIRALFEAVIILVGLIGFGFFYSILSLQAKKVNSSPPAHADVAVVFGSAVWSDNKPSPSLSKRVEKAIDLYKAGVAGKIQLTGGNAPGELSEAEVAYNIVKKSHIDLKNVLVEKKTSSSIEQVQFIKRELVEKGNMKNIIVISDGFHLNRINEICNFHNIKPQLVASELSLSWEKNIYYKLRESVGLIFFWLFAI
jgi:uncharacterized SAM-binding protein YcdF (DUF218 family)